uniref:Uncharacterized protein n=1 Tax=Arundo donax TaxID=35708 RepID=A0A0A9DRM1_ARUDO
MSSSGAHAKQPHQNPVLKIGWLCCSHHCKALRTIHLSAHLRGPDFSEARLSPPHV